MGAAPMMRLTLGRKFGLLAAATAFAAVSLATVLAIARAEELAHLTLQRRAHTLAATIGTAYLEPILAGDVVNISLDRLLGVILDREEDLARVVVRDRSGAVLADIARDRAGGRVVLAEPILLPGPTGKIRLGEVEASFSTAELDEGIRGLRVRFIGIALAVTAGALGAAWLFARTVTRPIQTLRSAAGRLRLGDYSARAEVETADEVGDLAATFNAMAGEIEENQRRLADDLVEIKAIQDFSREISAELTHDRLYGLIVRTFQRVADVSKVSLLLHDEKTDSLRIVEGIGIDPRAYDLRFRRGEAIVGRILETGESILLDDIRSDPQYVGRKDAPDARKETLLALPLIFKEKVIGVVCLNDKIDGTPFHEHDRTILATLAASAAVALENARLYELAITDGLTGLFIHRYFQQRMDEEIARARRYGHRLSLLMIDIDHFKMCNDTYGHQTGDHVLVSLARVIKRNLREADIACRYGGEEFSIILTDTDEAGSKVVADRIRADAEAFEFQGPAGRLRVTISVGASTYREGVVKDELISEADKALYAAKNAGRNRIRHFAELPRI